MELESALKLYKEFDEEAPTFVRSRNNNINNNNNIFNNDEDVPKANDIVRRQGKSKYFILK